MYMESRKTALMNLLAGQEQKEDGEKGLVDTQGKVGVG